MGERAGRGKKESDIGFRVGKWGMGEYTLTPTPRARHQKTVCGRHALFGCAVRNRGGGDRPGSTCLQGQYRYVATQARRVGGSKMKARVYCNLSIWVEHPYRH